eukprot:TRINITY_DN36701_c0_g1_i1.p1 TRINITY_DN36701_c0_g1~~TRINITY_DN36701_c0_g1_i1.p1  ORF type:complete len:406 (+),score=57.20 TRINITY_DN36701_c0_g1_i1:69-1286(+)
MSLVATRITFLILVGLLFLWLVSILRKECESGSSKVEELQELKSEKVFEASKCPSCGSCAPCGECVPCSPCLTEAQGDCTTKCNSLVERAKEKAKRIPIYSEQLLCREAGYCNYTLSSKPASSLLDVNDIRVSYLYTLRNSLTGVLLGTDRYEADVGRELKRREFSPQDRLNGKDWPTFGNTMTGVRRMEALDMLLRKAFIEKKLEGSFMETGVWRGGSCIYASAFLHAYQNEIPTGLNVYVYDSFSGLPKKEHPGDARFWAYMNYVSVSEEQVRDYYQRYGLLGSNVHFVKGWFQDTVPNHSTPISILRLDGDMYKSTLEVLCHIYPFLVVGGYWIVDDWNIPAAHSAVSDFIGNHSITDTPHPIEGTDINDPNNVAVWFEKTADVSIQKDWCQAELGRKWNGK